MISLMLAISGLVWIQSSQTLKYEMCFTALLAVSKPRAWFAKESIVNLEFAPTRYWPDLFRNRARTKYVVHYCTTKACHWRRHKKSAKIHFFVRTLQRGVGSHHWWCSWSWNLPQIFPKMLLCMKITSTRCHPSRDMIKSTNTQPVLRARVDRTQIFQAELIGVADLSTMADMSVAINVRQATTQKLQNRGGVGEAACNALHVLCARSRIYVA